MLTRNFVRVEFPQSPAIKPASYSTIFEQVEIKSSTITFRIKLVKPYINNKYVIHSTYSYDILTYKSIYSIIFIALITKNKSKASLHFSGFGS